MTSLVDRAQRVKLMVFDVDGVLTDGALWYGPGGEALKRFDVKDGHAMVMARLTGLPVALLTARISPIVDVRAAELKLAKVLQGRREKSEGLLEICKDLGVAPSECSYMGDDVNDLAALRMVGLSACPANAVAEVKNEVHFVSAHPGGHGAARELVELVLKATPRWAEAMTHMR